MAILKSIKLYTLKGYILWYVNYISVFKKWVSAWSAPSGSGAGLMSQETTTSLESSLSQHLLERDSPCPYLLSVSRGKFHDGEIRVLPCVCTWEPPDVISSGAMSCFFVKPPPLFSTGLVPWLQTDSTIPLRGTRVQDSVPCWQH